MEKEIEEIMENFQRRLDKYYENSICKDETLRLFNGTNIKIKEFYEIYCSSDYFKDFSDYDKDVNKKIVTGLIDIIILNIIINEIDLIDNIGVNAFESSDEFASLYNMSKAMNLINKTRILWERIMNFIYLIIERKVLDDCIPKRKSKKTFFKNWFNEKGYKFLEEYNKFIEVYDEKYRTPETHKQSTLRKFFIENKPFPIIGISFKMTKAFGTNIYPNIISILKKEKYIRLTWNKVKSLNGESVPEEFNNMPKWAEEFVHENKLDKKNIENVTITIEMNY